MPKEYLLMVALSTQPPSRSGKGGTSVPPPAKPMRSGALARISIYPSRLETSAPVTTGPDTGEGGCILRVYQRQRSNPSSVNHTVHAQSASDKHRALTKLRIWGRAKIPHAKTDICHH